MKEIIDWFKKSHRLLHFLGGIAIGAGGNDWYCGLYAGACAAGALEFKDYQWGGRPDWVDFLLTFAGAAAGQGIRQLIF